MAGKFVRTSLAVLILAAAGLPAPPSAWGDEEIVIYSTGVLPAVLKTRMEERVLFVNRSGKAMYVEFPEASDQHHLFQVPAQIWAVFHRPGRHPYLVHLTDGQAAELRGAVDVEGDPRERPDSQPCDGVTVLGTCLRR